MKSSHSNKAETVGEISTNVITESCIEKNAIHKQVQRKRDILYSRHVLSASIIVLEIVTNIVHNIEHENTNVAIIRCCTNFVCIGVHARIIRTKPPIIPAINPA